MKINAFTLLLLLVGGAYCVLVVAWRENVFSNGAAARSDAAVHGGLHRTPVRIKPGSHPGLVARLLHTKHLTPSDREDFAACQERHRNVSDEWRLGTCVFIDPTNRSAVALVSLPGSGNTWLRGLLERATGVCTGAIYCDVSLRAQGFSGEAIKSGAVLVVKTHVWWSGWNNATLQTLPLSRHSPPPYGSAILLVRNPALAVVAEWNRKNALVNSSFTMSHTYSAGPEMFGMNKAWSSFLRKQMAKWMRYFEEWLVKRGSHPVMVVRYEDIQADPAHKVSQILDFLHFPYKFEVLRRQMSQDFTTFQRHHHSTFEHFTEEQRALVKLTITNAASYLNQTVGSSFRVEEYSV